MAVIAGTRVGPYEVVEKLGQGGMGEVYRASDTQLKRTVALKILPPTLATDPQRLARFRREAELLAALNHPNIAQIYGIQTLEGDAAALVMEFVPGEDLAALMSHGPVPVKQALVLARQIAEALEAAHDQGIVHRDLKPANIRVTDEGTVKVLDFGLAKANDEVGPVAGSARDLTQSPTMTSPALTLAGVILGTAAYMSPEQAKGRPVDRRADVWAFGVVLYEMLVGRRLFDREDVSETLAAVLTFEPDLGALPDSSPPAVRRLLERCLMKDKRQRLDSMTAARLDIEEALRSPAPTTVMSRVAVSRSAVVALVVASLVVGGLAMRIVGGARTAQVPTLPTVAEIGAPPGVISTFHDGFALSPDGAALALVARDASGMRQIWIRRLDEITAHPLDGTTNATYPFWSPDGGHIGFFVNGMLRQVPANGGSAQTICPAIGIFPSGSWSDHNDILFSVLTQGSMSIFKVPASGGTPVPLNINGRSPQWLPGGHQFLFAADTSNPDVQLASSEAGTPKTIVSLEPMERSTFFYASGHLFANRGGAFTVQRVDPATLTPAGSPVVITGPAGTPKNWLAVSAAADAVVALAGPRQSAAKEGDFGDPIARLRWVDRQGTSVGDAGEPDRYWAFRLAPDGRRIATTAGDHTRILGTGTQPVRIPEQGYGPVWSPDGSRITLQEPGGPKINFVERDAPSIAITGVRVEEDVTDWSMDGTRLLVTRNPTPKTPSTDIIVVDVATRSTSSWLSTAANEQHGRFSPDGRHVAYTSDASGEDEVYVRDFSGDAVAISLGKGVHPTWRRDGRELFFLGPNDEMMAVEMTAAGQPAGAPKQLFRIPLNDITRVFQSPYDVAPDGQRFLLNVPETPTPLLYIRGFQHWLDRRQEPR